MFRLGDQGRRFLRPELVPHLLDNVTPLVRGISKYGCSVKILFS